FVVCDEDGYGRVKDDCPEEQFKFSRTVLQKPRRYPYVRTLRGQTYSFAPSRRQNVESIHVSPCLKASRTPNGPLAQCYHHGGGSRVGRPNTVTWRLAATIFAMSLAGEDQAFLKCDGGAQRLSRMASPGTSASSHRRFQRNCIFAFWRSR